MTLTKLKDGTQIDLTASEIEVALASVEIAVQQRIREVYPELTSDQITSDKSGPRQSVPVRYIAKSK